MSSIAYTKSGTRALWIEARDKYQNQFVLLNQNIVPLLTT